MHRVSLVKTKGHLTPREKLKLEILAATPTKDHMKVYGKIADGASEEYEKRLAEQNLLGPKQEAAILGTEVELGEARRKFFLNKVMRVTKETG